MSSDVLFLTPKRHGSAITTILPDGHVAIIRLGSSVGFTLCPAGAILWELSDGRTPVKEIIDDVLTLLDEANKGTPVAALDREKMTAELSSLVGSLLDRGYLYTPQESQESP